MCGDKESKIARHAYVLAIGLLMGIIMLSVAIRSSVIFRCFKLLSNTIHATTGRPWLLLSSKE
jgi:hypothetical protein